ncbi:MAG: HD-GYP domain-containing protein [Chloroflexi bacterium]|nr:HD-GYP domain-containing protein [Chloroflexota bacterium]
MAAGMILGRNIYSERGDILLRRGVTLTPKYIDALCDRGLSVVYVADPSESGLSFDGPVSEQVHASAVKSIANLFEMITHMSKSGCQSGFDPNVTEVKSAKLNRQAIARLATQMLQTVESIIDEVLRGETLLALNSLRSHDTYTYCHSVDMTITALLIARKMFFKRESMRRLAIGCMLHDIGKTFINQSILVKPDKLTPEEAAAMRTHPVLGYELLTDVIEDSMARHVVLQHHERQDGLGYPRGLVGTNRISRDDFERYESGRILLIAEIAAVADVYDALTSDRPYRHAYSVDQVVELLAKMSGTHLNREIVSHFVSILPHYPAGMDVEIVGGHYDGCQGVVSTVEPGNPHRPVVLVLRNRFGVSIEPTEIDLSKEVDVAIRSIFVDPNEVAA